MDWRRSCGGVCELNGEVWKSVPGRADCLRKSVKRGKVHARMLISLLPSALLVLVGGVARPAVPAGVASPLLSVSQIRMGLFDGFKAAFANEEFKEDDQRVRASHILVKGEGDVERIATIMGELAERVGQQPDQLPQVFADLARRESECSSSSMGGDLGLFGPGKMVGEFDDVLFPEDPEAAPPAGTVIGPVVTDFGCHVILVTKREQNRDQVEEKLARND